MDSTINSLASLQKYRSAPTLDIYQEKALLEELSLYIKNADWFTVGIMAPCYQSALLALRELENYFNWTPMKIKIKPKEEEEKEPVFLKANQTTGDIYVRTEYNLGKGIILSCQHDNKEKVADTIGPLPLDIFKKKHYNS